MCEKLCTINESREDLSNIQPDTFFWRPEGSSQCNASRIQRLIPPDFADPKCPLCEHIIREVNEIFEQDDTPCQGILHDPPPGSTAHMFGLEVVETMTLSSDEQDEDKKQFWSKYFAENQFVNSIVLRNNRTARVRRLLEESI